jgi:hypothetical protein
MEPVVDPPVVDPPVVPMGTQVGEYTKRPFEVEAKMNWPLYWRFTAGFCWVPETNGRLFWVNKTGEPGRETS